VATPVILILEIPASNPIRGQTILNKVAFLISVDLCESQGMFCKLSSGASFKMQSTLNISNEDALICS
jgi:hypothetical protein